MPRINCVAETAISRSPRARQLEAMFDVPAAEKCRLSWSGDAPFDAKPWNVGLIVGPSGCGKSTIARHLFDIPETPAWNGRSVIDDFANGFSIEDIARVCQAVGFNTIPAWLRPYAVLSTGERFRVGIARALLEQSDPIVIDEFTSVVDRQVAQIGANAVQKYVRANGRQFVAVSCHYDIVAWLQPDWIFEPATMQYTAREGLQRRPPLDISIGRVPYTAWRMFAPFHYLTANLHRAARCFTLFVGGHPATFGAMLHRPHPRVKDVMGLSRLVTLPDWQGLGLAMILSDKLGAAYRAIGKRMHTYPAHPSLVRSFDHSKNWAMRKKPGHYSPVAGASSTIKSKPRPCAVFEYVGEAMPLADARRLLETDLPQTRGRAA
jgi:ABC-type Mn2+/Zn2+ transport system ATPase subunit